MPLSIEKEMKIRAFLKEIDGPHFVQLVENALEGWKIVNPVKGILGVMINDTNDTWIQSQTASGCCLFGAATLNRSVEIVRSLDLKLKLSGNVEDITWGFDNPNSPCYAHSYKKWAAQISKIIFED